MNFVCFLCGKEFDNIKFIILHLKVNHFIKDETIPIKCLVAGNICTDEFYSFTKLKIHMKNCQPTTEYKPKSGFRQTNLGKSFESIDISGCVSK